MHGVTEHESNLYSDSTCIGRQLLRRPHPGELAIWRWGRRWVEVEVVYRHVCVCVHALLHDRVSQTGPGEVLGELEGSCVCSQRLADCCRRFHQRFPCPLPRPWHVFYFISLNFIFITPQKDVLFGRSPLWIYRVVVYMCCHLFSQHSYRVVGIRKSLVFQREIRR